MKKIIALVLLVLLIPTIAMAQGTAVDIAQNYEHYGGANLARLNNGSLFALIATGYSDYQDYWDITKTDRLFSVSSDYGNTWSPTRMGIQHGSDWGAVEASLLYTSNGVLFMKFSKYKGYRNPSDSKVYIMRSGDNGVSWSSPVYISTGHNYNAGPANGIQMRDGTLIWPFSWGTESGDEYWKSSVLISTDQGCSWTVGGTIDFPSPTGNGCDEPTVIERADGSLYALVRTMLGELCYSVSHDRGLTWSEPVPSGLVSGNINGMLLRKSFNPDIILVSWNNSLNRYPLVIAQSSNGGTGWGQPYTIVSKGYNTCMPNLVYTPEDDKILINWWDNRYPGVDRMRATKISYTSIPVHGTPPPPPPPPPPPTDTVLLDTLTQFTGTNFIDLGSLPAIKQQSIGAIKAWVKPTANGVIIASGTNNAQLPYLMLTTWGYYGYDVTNEDISNSNLSTYNVWHAIVWQVNGGVWELYDNGVKQNLTWLRGSNHGFWWSHYQTDNFAIGVLNRVTNYSYFTGSMRKVVSYTAPLTLAQIQQDYQNMLAEGLP